MASIIRVKRSTGTLAPSSLNFGELGLTVGVGTFGNKGGRLFAGDNSSNPQVIGGRYFTDLLSIEPGKVAGQSNPTTAANGFVPIVDQTGRVDQWNVDNLRLDGNALTSTDTDGHITITPNGSGRVQILDDDELQFGTSDDIRMSFDSVKDALFIERGTAGATADVRVADDLHLQFGTDNDARIYYDEASSDRVKVEGASWTYSSSVSQILIDASTPSTNSTSGAFVVTGGVGIGGTVNIAGDLAIEGGDVTSSNANLNLFNTTVSRVNIFGDATDIVFGASTGIATIRNATVDLDGDLNVDGGDITSNQSLFNLLTTNVLSANVLTSATNIVIGETTGVTTIRNATVDIPNATTLNFGSVSSPSSAIFSSTSNTSYVSIAATTNTTSTTDGALRVAGGVGIEKNLYVGGELNVQGVTIGGGGGGGDLNVTGNLAVEGNTTLGNSSTDNTTITGIVTHIGTLTNVGGVTIDNVGISSNIISTKSGGGNKLYIDPYPDGLSNEGTVIIKGDLQVDGTTTIVNSVTVTSNNPIYVVGDNATTRTVMSTASSGANQLTLDSVAGINTSDVVSGLNIPSNTTITNVNSGTKVITISNNTSGSIDSGTEITISQGVDTNDDRGIAFKYVSSGVGTEAVVKTGFFGYTDINSRWTYVPDAGIAGNVVTGTKGFLDIKGIYYQSGDFSANGISYFDSLGLLKSTVAPGSGISTSNYLLTTDEFGVPTWTDTLDGGIF